MKSALRHKLTHTSVLCVFFGNPKYLIPVAAVLTLVLKQPYTAHTLGIASASPFLYSTPGRTNSAKLLRSRRRA